MVIKNPVSNDFLFTFDGNIYVFDCIHAKMAIKNSVTYDFLSTFVNSFNVFDCRISGVSGRARMLCQILIQTRHLLHLTNSSVFRQFVLVSLLPGLCNQ